MMKMTMSSYIYSCLLQPTLLLPSIETTAWMKLYAACHDPALITVTGLDYDFFAKLLALFGLYYNDFTPWTLDGWIHLKSDPDFCGQKHIMDDATCLALAQTYMHTRGSLFMLQVLWSDCHAIGHVDAVQEADNHQDSPKP
jgi:hypothetical protein